MGNEERRELLGLVAALSDEQVREVLACARGMLATAGVDVSYGWSDEDTADLVGSSRWPDDPDQAVSTH
ncbi:MAG: hypothetical protein K2W96_27705 [Gemmataceae bacterium]|nr:hypothetical protein [Gemmataceae bacterium]